MAENNQKLSATVLVIFGATGDLAQRKLLPALAALEKNQQLPAQFKVLAISRRQVVVEDVLSEQCRHLQSKLDIFQMDLEDENAYAELKNKINSELHQARIIFYFAVPPAAILPIVRRLGKAGLNHQRVKLLLEKPFGVDYESAAELIHEIDRHFKEEQVYRIDHYLAKEMAQNIAVFIGANAMIRDVWSSRFIEKIEVLGLEEIGIEGRVGFYEQTGALRDFVQSHLLQLAALVLMRPCPDLFDFKEIPQHRLEALRRLKLPSPDEYRTSVFRGQYEGYREEVKNPGSTTETFVFLKLLSDDPRWRGTRLELATGKAMDKKLTEIRVHFKTQEAMEANLLSLRIQPREGIELGLWVKKPGYDQDLQKLPLQFSYEQHFGANLPDAYEQVLIDAMRARASLFASSAEVLATWKILDPVLRYWSLSDRDLKIYKKGSSLQQVLDSQV